LAGQFPCPHRCRHRRGGGMIRQALADIARGTTLGSAQAGAVFEQVMDGGATPGQIGALLMGLAQRGETIEELTAAAAVMRSRALGIKTPPGAVDCCGTGGDNAHTLNISTAVS